MPESPDKPTPIDFLGLTPTDAVAAVKGGKPLILYVCGQSFNLILTLTMAYIMFYLVFPEITARI